LFSRQFGLKRLLTDKDHIIHETNQQVAEKDRALAEKDRQLAEKDRTISDLKAQVQALKDSWSWQITAPLRKLARLAKK
jgi:hypothetical protein